MTTANSLICANFFLVVVEIYIDISNLAYYSSFYLLSKKMDSTIELGSEKEPTKKGFFQKIK